MDSLTHVVLGAAVGMAVMGRRTALWKAALWGAVCNTLPDLDTFIDHGDPVRNMTLHRADSHALLWLTMAAPPIAWTIARLQSELALFKRWWLAVWLALVAHPLLDVMTVYGTQLARPFTDRPYGLGSIFIADPLFTLPLIAGVCVALVARSPRGLRWNAGGLLLGATYLGWGVAVQHHVTQLAHASLAAQGIAAQRVLVTPTPLNSVLWRVVAVSGDAYHESFHSLFDDDGRLRFERFDRREALRTALAGQASVERLVDFTHGFYKMAQRGDQVLITDLRMGQEPVYAFVFVVAEGRGSQGFEPLAVPLQEGGLPPLEPALEWLWRRALGEQLASPR